MATTARDFKTRATLRPCHLDGPLEHLARFIRSKINVAARRKTQGGQKSE